MRILITGATGLVGNNCLRHLSQHEHELNVLVRRNHDVRPFEGLTVKKHVADLRATEKLKDVIPDVDVVIHAAGDTHIGRQPRPIQFAVNVQATEEIARIALHTGAKLIHVSSVDALPAGTADRWIDEEAAPGAAKHPCGYVSTKRAAEQAVLQQIDDGLDGVIVNPGFMLGPWDWKPSSGRMLLEVATKFTPFGPKGGFSVCDIRDVAEAICKLATSEAQHNRYILAGNNVRYIEAWRIFAKVSGSSGPICPAGPLMRLGAGRWGDMMTWLSGEEGDLNSAAISMSDLWHYYDSSRARNELNYQVRPIADSARAAWEWFQEYGYMAGGWEAGELRLEPNRNHGLSL